MARPIAKLLIGFFIVAALLAVAAVILTVRQPLPPPPQLPKPNGYDNLAQASQMLADKTLDYDTMTEGNLRALVEKNAKALKLARTGLSRECQVPLDYAAPSQTYYRALSGFKRLAQTLVAEGRLAELEGHPKDAAEDYLTVVRLGYAISRGGLLIDVLVGVAIQNIGATHVEKLVLMLDAKQCRAAAAALEACEARSEPIPTILARERAWARHAYGLKGEIARLVMFKSLKQSEQRAVSRITAQQTRSRRLLAELAARAYELEKGEPPKTLADLVPAYLKSIPQDPLTGTNLAFP